MNKKELKQALKPLIKETIREILFEEGVLSGIVSEVAKGMAGANTIVEARQPQARQRPEPDQALLAEQEQARMIKRRAKISETRKKMQEAIGSDAYGGVNLFEGTEALASAGAPSESPSAGGPLSGLTPGDSGVDISGIFSNNWSKLAAGNKR